MSVNWVMLSDTDGFVLLNQEKRLWSSPLRTSLAVNSLSKYPGREPYSLAHSTGILHLTNRRIIYLPQPSTSTFQSFAAPLERLQDTHVSAPWFGANAWVAICQPVSGGGIPARVPAVELKVTFNDGGAYDFHTAFERTKERLLQALEVARANGVAVDGQRGSTRGSGGGGGGTQAGVDLATVHLEDLPAYDGPGLGYVHGGYAAPSLGQPAALAQETAVPSQPARASEAGTSQPSSTPAEPPPGYEQVQAEAVADGLRMRRRPQGEDGDDDDGDAGGVIDRDRDGSLI